MAYGHLQHTRHGLQEAAQVVAVQVVAGVDPQPRGLRGGSGVGKAGQLLLLRRAAVSSGIGLGVELDPVHPQRAGLRHGGGHGVHEQAHAHAQGVGLVDERAQAFAIGS